MLIVVRGFSLGELGIVGDFAYAIVMSMTLYLSDGKDVLGPFSPHEVLQYVQAKNIKDGGWQICDETHIWKPLAQEITALALKKVEPSNVRNIIESAGGTAPSPGPTKKITGLEDKLDLPGSLEQLGKLRVAFDALWHKQRERLVALVKNREPDDNLKVTGKEHRALNEHLHGLVIDFWRKSGVLLEWIKEITWGDPSELGDCYFKLSSSDLDKKMEEAGKVLREKEIYDWAGCYCFLAGDKYVYVGMTTDSLGDRITIGHKNKFFWEQTDGIRILIPKNAKQCKKLERLLILAYEPKVNDSDGHKCSAADECLDLIEKEIEELTLP